MDDVIFMIEGGKALEMVKAHIAEVKRVGKEARELAKELGVQEIMTDRQFGVLAGVIFPGAIHADFTKPKGKSRASYPKKGSAWAARLAEQKGYRDQSEWISTEFNIPLTISYRGEGSWGSTCIGSMLSECGFLFLGEDGPYAMWIPDVSAHVAECTSRGYTVDEPAASFKMEIEGCRRVDKEEWEILVLQHELAEKQRARAAA